MHSINASVNSWICAESKSRAMRKPVTACYNATIPALQTFLNKSSRMEAIYSLFPWQQCLTDSTRRVAARMANTLSSPLCVPTDAQMSEPQFRHPTKLNIRPHSAAITAGAKL